MLNDASALELEVVDDSEGDVGHLHLEVGHAITLASKEGEVGGLDAAAGGETVDEVLNGKVTTLFSVRVVLLIGTV